MKNSRIKGFYTLSVSERAGHVADWAGLTDAERDALIGQTGLTPGLADKFIENVVGIFGLPLGIAVNFIVNGRDVLVPMAVEEPSIVAGASFMARLVRDGGGFTARSTAPEMIGQVQLLEVPDIPAATRAVEQERSQLLAIAASKDPLIISLGGGPREINAYPLDTEIGPMLIVQLVYDCRDAMGANMVNTACEAIAQPLEEITGGRAGLRILSNLADRRVTIAECIIPAASLAFKGFDGDAVADGIVEAWAFAAADPYRAATHNKGIMNGIDPVVIATGNDWRAVEAGAHAYAARGGRYTSLTRWSRQPDGSLKGILEMPMAVGIVGGATRSHPGARSALKILGVATATELAEIIVSVGLAQNLAALRALATEGIQKGHMALHARQVAISAGATGEEAEQLAGMLVDYGTISVALAEELLRSMRKERTE